MKYLMVTLGSWQSTLASAVVGQMQIEPATVDTLLLIADRKSPLVEASRKIHELNGFCRFQIRTYEGDGYSEDAEGDAIDEAYDVVLLPGLGGRAMLSIVSQLLPKAKVILYEDGLHATCRDFFYGALSRLDDRSISCKVTEAARLLYLRKWRVFGLTRRLIGEYHLLPVAYRSLRQSEDILIEGVQEQLRKLGGSVQCEGSSTPKKLILGTNFASFGLLQPSCEYQPVFDYIEKMEEGEECWWKSHPRADKLYTEIIKDRYPQVRHFPEQFNGYPVEAFIEGMKIREMVSFHSSALLYGKRLFGISAQVLGDPVAVLSTSNYPDFVKTAEYMEKELRV